MRLLLVGNHTCGNRGDAAILRGVLQELRRQCPGVDVTITSRHPVSSTVILGEPVRDDHFTAFRNGIEKSNKLARKFKNFLNIWAYTSYLKGVKAAESLLPDEINTAAADFSTYDAVIQVGGSFFVDLYGYGQYDYIVASKKAGVPSYWIGHSVGPFEGQLYKLISKAAFKCPQQVILREKVSLAIMKSAGIEAAELRMGADTAWLVDPQASVPRDCFMGVKTDRPIVAITLRDLAPFDKRLGISQAKYESAFAALVDSLIAKGYRVVAVSTCTGIEGYKKDDRISALRVKEKVKDKTFYDVRLDEATDEDLGLLFKRCAMVVATRLHSAIISMNYGTPAIALNYEHKSKGIMEQLGLAELSMEVGSLLDGTLEQAVGRVLEQNAEYREKVAKQVAQERVLARTIVQDVLKDVRERQSKRVR